MELTNYKSSLNIFDTQRAIKFIKDEFIARLSETLNLRRVTAPLFVYPETGLNDNLNGYERPVKFDVASLNKEVEIVQSLAKWKRYGLAKYSFPMHLHPAVPPHGRGVPHADLRGARHRKGALDRRATHQRRGRGLYEPAGNARRVRRHDHP